MKRSDDYSAKIDFWARAPRVHPMPRIANLPRFPPQKFRSHEEMNAWKRRLLEELAQQGGARWTR